MTENAVKPKILLVDDEKDVLEFLSYNFRRSGYEVQVASSGREGLSVMRAFVPDLIIADIMMPEMNGVVMCKLLKSDPEFSHTPVIFLSATQDDYQVIHAGIAGEDYISKPVRFPVLLNIVERFVRPEKITP